MDKITSLYKCKFDDGSDDPIQCNCLEVQCIREWYHLENYGIHEYENLLKFFLIKTINLPNDMLILLYQYYLKWLEKERIENYFSKENDFSMLVHCGDRQFPNQYIKPVSFDCHHLIFRDKDWYQCAACYIGYCDECAFRKGSMCYLSEPVMGIEGYYYCNHCNQQYEKNEYVSRDKTRDNFCFGTIINWFFK